MRTHKKRVWISVVAATIVALMAAPVAAQIVPAQNQVTQSPFGGLVYSTSTSGTAKLGQLKGAAYGDITYWNGSAWTTGATSTLGIPSGVATSSFAATYPIKLTLSTAAINYSLLDMATTTATCAGTVSCTSFVILGVSPITITGASSGSGNVSTSGVPVIGQIPFWSTNTATPALLGTIATTTQTFAGPFSISAAQGYLVGGNNATITWTGLATTSSQPSSSNLLVSNGGAGVYGVATSTLSASSPLTGSFTQIGSGGTLGCQTASVLQAGCVAAVDFSKFNSATTTFSSPLVYTIGTNAVTCPTCQIIGTDWPFTPSTYDGVANQSTTTPLWLKNTRVIASTTYFTAASTTLFTNTGATWLTGLTSGQLVSTGANGLLTSTTSIGNNQLANSSIIVTTASPLGGAGTIPLGGTLALTCASCTTSSATSTNPLMFTYSVSTSTTATSTFAGPVQIGFLATYPYLQVGSTTPLNTTRAGNFLNIVGRDNTTNGVQGGITNIDAGASAYGFLYFNNDKSDNSNTHYGGFQYNSNGYTDTAFGTGIGVGNQLSMWATDGPLTFISASSTCASCSYQNFLLGGSNTGNEVMRLLRGGKIVMGTTTVPAVGVLTVGSSTVPQLMLSDNVAADNLWSIRNTSGNAYFATSTATATSTVAALFFNGLSGAATFGSPATTTFTGGIQGTYLNLTGANTATSTSANGFNITGGCFSILGTCITGGGSSFSGTVGQVDYFTGTNAAAGTSSLYIATSQNVGVGTTTPTSLLDVAGSFLVSTWTNITNAFRITNNTGATVLNVDTTNTTGPKFGIGSSTPTASLTVQLNNGDTNLTALLMASSTATATTTLFRIDNVGHQFASSTNPVLSSCGTAPTMTGSDHHGTVTAGATASGCTITFGVTYPVAPTCVVSNQSMSVVNAMTYTISATALTISEVGLGGAKFDYICYGN